MDTLQYVLETLRPGRVVWNDPEDRRGGWKRFALTDITPAVCGFRYSSEEFRTMSEQSNEIHRTGRDVIWDVGGWIGCEEGV